MRYQISCHSDAARSDARKPCLNISPQYKIAFIRNSQAWAPGPFSTDVGVTGL